MKVKIKPTFFPPIRHDQSDGVRSQIADFPHAATELIPHTADEKASDCG
jgi:hypothetical protein